MAAEHAPRAARLIARRLAREIDPGVREAYVYALGWAGRPQDFDLIADIVRNDLAPYNRHTAWLSAARLDPERFRDLAATTAVGPDGWDQIGLAYAWLEVGDVRGVDELLHWAVAGASGQRAGAARALYRRVAPLLDAAGHWPLDVTVKDGEEWPAELVAAIRRRCAELDLQALAADTHPHTARAVAVRRNAGKLHRARERLARLLTWL